MKLRTKVLEFIFRENIYRLLPRIIRNKFNTRRRIHQLNKSFKSIDQRFIFNPTQLMNIRTNNIRIFSKCPKLDVAFFNDDIKKCIRLIQDDEPNWHLAGCIHRLYNEVDDEDIKRKIELSFWFKE